MSTRTINSSNSDNTNSVSENENDNVSSKGSVKSSIKEDEATEIYIDNVTFQRNTKGLKINRENRNSMSRNLLFSVLFHFTKKKVDNYVGPTNIDISYRVNRFNNKDDKKIYTAYFKNEYLQTLYTIIKNQCLIQEKGNGKEICNINKSVIGDKLKFDMLPSFEKNLPEIDLYMKIEDLGTLHPSVVSLHYSKESNSTIETLDNDDFYKHIIENPEEYTIPPDAIKLIIVLYVDHLLKANGDNNSGGSNKTRKKRQKYKK